MPNMSFGLALDFGTERTSLDRVLDGYIPAIRLAERYGFDSVFAGEQFPDAPGNFHIPAPFLVLASLAPRTSLRLGTGVSLMPGWQPLRLAYEGAMLDQLSGGRFTLGIAVGNPPDWKRFGIDRAIAGKRLDEMLMALKALWRGESGFHGELTTIDQTIRPLPLQPGGPPIWVGGMAPRAARRAATLGDGWYAATPYRRTDMAGQIRRYRQALQDAGKDPDSTAVVANRLTFLAPTNSSLAEGRPYLERVLRSYARGGGLLAQKPGADGAPVRLDPDAPDLIESTAAEISLIGTPEMVREQIQAYAADGVNQIQMRVAPGDMPPELIAQTITLAGEQILPHFRQR